jgi:hypothetical protein
VLLLVPLLRWSPARWTPTQVLLLLAFGLQSLLHARVLVWWFMVLPWVALPHLQALCQRYLPGLGEERNRADLRKTILAVLVAVIVLVWSVPAQWLVFREPPLGSNIVHGITPLQTSAYLREQYRNDREGRLQRVVFAPETVGDYLLWDLRDLDPPVRMFCYSHVHLLTPEHWQKVMVVKSGQRGWQQVLDDHGVQFLVVDRFGPGEPHEELIRQVRAAPDRWEEVKLRDAYPEVGTQQEVGRYLFVAKRKSASAR